MPHRAKLRPAMCGKDDVTKEFIKLVVEERARLLGPTAGTLEWTCSMI